MPEKRRLLEMALKGLEAEQAKLEEEIAEVRSQLNLNHATNGTSDENHRKRFRMSAAARRKISEAMKRRHAEARKASRAAA